MLAKTFQLGDRKGPWMKLRTDADFDIQRQKVSVKGPEPLTADAMTNLDPHSRDIVHAALCKGSGRIDKGHL